jgi:hypothetical protein
MSVTAAQVPSLAINQELTVILWTKSPLFCENMVAL